METSTLIPVAVGILIILGTFASVVALAVRTEVRTNSNTSDIDDIYRRIEKHESDRSVHHDGDELDRRFSGVEKGVEEIKGQIKEGIDRLTRRFDDFLNKQK